MSTTLPLFWKLSSASKKDRVDASVKLIGTLEQFQALHVAQSRPDGSDDDGDGLDALNSQDVSYSIRRLVRGLASPRESSRLGFSVALTELLSRIDTVTCAQVVSLIVDSTKRQGSMNGQEERDVLFARLFGITAVVRSGLLVRQRQLNASGGSGSGNSSSSNEDSSSEPVSSLETFASVLTCLLEIGEAKSWLRESAWWTIGLAIDAVQSSSVPWKAGALHLAIRAVYARDENGYWTPDKVAITLKLQPMTPNHDWDETLAPAFKGQNIFAPNNLSSLGRILKESAVDENEDTLNPSGGSWKAQLHLAWDVIFDRLLPRHISECVSQGSFSEFFRIVVDESLFSSSSSPERKYWGFQVFKKALARVSADELPLLFTKNLMRSWINHLSNKDRYLHKISLDVAKHIQKLVQTSPSLGFPLILQLTGVNGSGQFDKLTRTKTVESILAVMDSEGIKNYVLSLLEQAISPKHTEEERSATDSRRTWIADQFAALVRNGSVPKSDEWIQIVLDFYVVHGLFVVCKKFEKSPVRSLRVCPVLPFTEAVQKHCRERLFGCLGILTANIMVVKQGEHTHKERGVASDGEFWTSKTLATIASLDGDARHVKPLLDVDEQVRPLLARTEKAIVQLRRAGEDMRVVASGFELVLSSLILQCRCGEADSLENLETALRATLQLLPTEKRTSSPPKPNLESKRKPTKSKSRPAPPSEEEDEDDDEDEERTPPPPVDVLVDVMIGLLENASAFARSVADESFARVTSAVRSSTVDLIVGQLERREPEELVADESESEGGYEDGTDEGEEDEDEDEDESKKGGSGSEAEENSEEDSEEEGESMSTSEEGNDEVADQVRKVIQDALKASGVNMDDDKDDDDPDDDSESDEELMDDEQMMALDDTLAEIFRTRTGERKSKKDKVMGAQREATHFKNRVLDLLDIFVMREPRSPLNVRLVLPLVELATKSTIDERQLSDKASAILKSRLAKSKDVPATAPPDEVETVLREVHQRAQRSHASGSASGSGSSFLALLSQASFYLCRVLVALDEAEAAVGVYRDSLDDYLSRKASQLTFGFFQDWARRFPALGWKLRDHVLAASFNAVNLYRRCQAFQLLQVVLGHPDKEEEPAAIAKFQKTLQKTILDLITHSIDADDGGGGGGGDRGLSPPQTKDLLKLVLFCVRQTRKTTTGSMAVVDVQWDHAAWTALRDRLSSPTSRFKSSSSVLDMCRQVESAVSQLKQEAVVGGGGKRKKAESDEEAPETADPSRKSNRKKQKKKVDDGRDAI